MSKFLIIPCPDNIEESLRLAEEYDFGFEYNDFFIPDVLDNKRLTDELIARYKGHELPQVCTMHGAFFDVILFSDDKRIRRISEERVRESLDIARELGVKGVVFHTNHNPALTADFYIKNWFERNEIFWRSILPEYSDIQVYMENMFDDSPKMLSGLARRLSDVPNFGVCLDYAHAVIYGSDIEEWVNTLSPYVKHMHINDNDLKNDLHLAVGDGKIDWKLFDTHFKGKLCGAETVLIETSCPKNQRRSAEFLRKQGII
ncbi:MAG: sugar phosphate isomerase/epimerase [Oscillospiraceae bacterium]|nr:sugar phosphate isomerase/epimerase [Oscillospiraceae bacterium]